MVKGEDWRNKPLAGADFVRSYGGRVEFVKLVSGISTTAIIGRIGADYRGQGT
jgi:D-beta-D-heptose 7-phosphate kinase/D-beta-D-heptose 1-phosphate adenosyltransferase